MKVCVCVCVSGGLPHRVHPTKRGYLLLSYHPEIWQVLLISPGFADMLVAPPTAPPMSLPMALPTAPPKAPPMAPSTAPPTFDP